MSGVDVDSRPARHDNLPEMIEHGFLAAMLALVGLEIRWVLGQAR